MRQLLTKLAIIGSVAGGYGWAVWPYTHEAGPVATAVTFGGWLFVVVPTIYLTWRLDLGKGGRR